MPSQSPFASPTPSSLFDPVQTPSSASSYNVYAPHLNAIPLPHTTSGLGGPQLHFLLGDVSTRYYLYNVVQPTNSICLLQNVNLNEPATIPIVASLRLRIPALNLVFDVANPRGLTIVEVLHAIHRNLQRSLSRDFYATISASMREATDRAYQARLKSGQITNKQLALVDCLGEKTRFCCLAGAPDNVWNVLLV
ncbi:hypothetical protein AX17_002014 [Amanita inopinata Kibby_2008]|nr:hypothetical protein AX17_002014 [Amanita inopinata Kibby_2008]